MLENLILSINIVLPLLLVMLAGCAASRARLCSETTITQMNNVCFRLFLPVLLMNNIRRADLAGAEGLSVLLYAMIGLVLLFMQLGTNGGQTLSGMSEGYRDFIIKPLFTLKTSSGPVTVPRYVLYSAIITAIVWAIWNKTAFGKNMYAVGSNEEAANVSGVNVSKTIILVFVMAGMLYGITGFMDAARIASVNATTGLNYEADAIAACVIGGISFVGGIGKVSGAIIGVLLLQIIFAGLNFLSVDANYLYIVKGLIILIACSIDMRKYLVRK